MKERPAIPEPIPQVMLSVRVEGGSTEHSDSSRLVWTGSLRCLRSESQK